MTNCELAEAVAAKEVAKEEEKRELKGLEGELLEVGTLLVVSHFDRQALHARMRTDREASS